MTERLHYDDPLLLAMNATVIARKTHGGHPSLVLDRTVFYPESGGQLADRGRIGEATVVDVQLDDEGRIHHLVAGPLPPEGSQVHGEVDGARRRQHMALHTAQHALSRAVLDAFGAVTLSSRLGETACTIDVDVAGLTLEAVGQAEAAVNALVDEDRPVRQYFPDDTELDGLALRKPPPETDRLRVVVIDGFDATPCGGTHVTHTSQIELVWVQAVERYKGGTRITFSAGPRARCSLFQEATRLRAIAQRLRCAPPETPFLIERLHERLDEARGEAGLLRARLADAWADRLRPEGPEIVAVIERGDRALLDLVAARLAPATRLVALAARADDGLDVVLMRGALGEELRCGALLKTIASAAGGRGGGRPDHARGRLPKEVDWLALVRAALAT